MTFADGPGQVTVPSIAGFNGTTPFSVELWANSSAMNGGYGFLVDHTDYDDARSGWLLRAGGIEGTHVNGRQLTKMSRGTREDSGERDFLDGVVRSCMPTGKAFPPAYRLASKKTGYTTVATFPTGFGIESFSNCASTHGTISPAGPSAAPHQKKISESQGGNRAAVAQRQSEHRRTPSPHG